MRPDDRAGFPVFQVGDGPDPTVKASRGHSFSIGNSDGSWTEIPGMTMLAVRGLRIVLSDAISPDTALVVSEPLYDEFGNLRPQTLITGIGRAEEAEET